MAAHSGFLCFSASSASLRPSLSIPCFSCPKPTTRLPSYDQVPTYYSADLCTYTKGHSHAMPCALQLFRIMPTLPTLPISSTGLMQRGVRCGVSRKEEAWATAEGASSANALASRLDCCHERVIGLNATAEITEKDSVWVAKHLLSWVPDH